MKLTELCDWALSQEGWAEDIDRISKLLVVNDFKSIEAIPENLDTKLIDWSKLLLVASILAKSNERKNLEAALTIAQGGLLISQDKLVVNSSTIVLNQLNNHRAVSDAVKKGLVSGDYLANLGVSARILTFREEMDGKVFSVKGEPITANKFQIDFWRNVEMNDWLYALAPTASGKSYIVLKYVMEQLLTKKANVVVYVAPTRALVSEVEQNFRDLSLENGLEISITSVPLKEIISIGGPCVYVFTQERLHIF